MVLLQFFTVTHLALGLPSVPAPSVLSMQEASAGHRTTDTIPGTEVTFDLVHVPGGPVLLGSPDGEVGRDDDEGPQRRVILGPYWIGVTEVTQEAYSIFRRRALDDHLGGSPDLPFDADAVTRPSPPYDDPAHGMGGNGRPAVGMTREAALRFAHWLSLKTGRLYRLPTEAEWERACRAGGTGPWGLETGAGEAPKLSEHAWFEANAEGVLRAVGTLQPNRWGLHDMLGNVAEWTSDPYHPDFYERLEDGTEAPSAGEPGEGVGVVRGGAFDDEAARLRCADRTPESASWKRRDPQIPKSRWWNTDSPHVGFRLVREAGEPDPSAIVAYWERVLGGS